jgi:hypothetical protein
MHALTRTRDLLCRSQALYHHATSLEDLAVLFAKGENQKPIIFIYYIILVEMEGVKAKLN